MVVFKEDTDALSGLWGVPDILAVWAGLFINSTF